MSNEAEIWRPSAALNPERLDYLWELTLRIAGTLVPETLRGTRNGNNFTEFAPEVIRANVFAVVEQADRWNISPFALLSAAAIVRGKLTFEGKVIAAVMEAQFGVKLHTYFRGQPGTDSYHIYLCDEQLPDEILAELKPNYRHDKYHVMDGSVSDWKTTGNGSPWRPATYGDMLTYRGTRQWARVYKSGAILGVLADDEIEYAALEHAAQSAIPIGQRFNAAGSAGFSQDNVARALEHNPQQPMDPVGEKADPVEKPEAQSGQAVEKTSPGPQGERAQASDVPSASADGGTRASAPSDAGSHETPSSPSHTGDDGLSRDARQTDASAPRVPADVWRGYHSALARMTKPDSIEKSHHAYWNGKGFKVMHPEDLQLGVDIKRNHLDRAAGKIEAAALSAEVEKWIVQITSPVQP